MPSSAFLQTLVAAIPEAALRPLILELLNGSTAPLTDGHNAAGTTTPAPAARRKGWPRGKPRGQRKPVMAAKRSRAQLDKLNAQRKAARAAARAARAKPAGSGNGGTAGNGAEPLAAQVWQHAERLQPQTPWRALAREFDLNEAACLDARRWGKLPPGFGPAEAARFLEMPAG